METIQCPPREQGSSVHNPADPLCVEYGGVTEAHALCRVCADRAEARTSARWFLDHAIDMPAREIGS